MRAVQVRPISWRVLAVEPTDLADSTRRRLVCSAQVTKPSHWCSAPARRRACPRCDPCRPSVFVLLR
jgi:hypothetical protein